MNQIELFDPNAAKPRVPKVVRDRMNTTEALAQAVHLGWSGAKGKRSGRKSIYTTPLFASTLPPQAELFADGQG